MQTLLFFLSIPLISLSLFPSSALSPSLAQIRAFSHVFPAHVGWWKKLFCLAIVSEKFQLDDSLDEIRGNVVFVHLVWSVSLA